MGQHLHHGHLRSQSGVDAPQFQANVATAHDQQGNPAYLAGVATDVTEQERTEQALREAEAVYHSLVESLPLNIFRKDLAGRIQFANQRFCETVGRPLSALFGQTDFDLFPRELAEKYRRDDVRVAETAEILDVVEEHRLPSGGLVYVHVLKAPLCDADGQVVGVQGMFWDVSARKEAEAALEIQAEKA